MPVVAFIAYTISVCTTATFWSAAVVGFAADFDGLQHLGVHTGRQVVVGKVGGISVMFNGEHNISIHQ